MKKLLKFLGLFTTQEYTLLNLEYNTQRDLVNLYRTRVDELEKSLAEEKTERKFLQDLIFKRFGVLIPEDSLDQSQTENLKPISNGPTRWSTLRNRLEQDDRQRVHGVHEEKRTA